MNPRPPLPPFDRESAAFRFAGLWDFLKYLTTKPSRSSRGEKM
jgi:hypothetical protein